MMLIRRELLGAAGAAPSDPYFENVTLLLHGDGTNGGQNNTFIDSSTNNFTITRNGNTTQGSFSPYGNLWSNNFDGNGDYLSVASNAAFGMGTGDFTLECWVFVVAYNGTGSVLIDLRSGTEPSVKPDLEFSSTGVLGYRVNGANRITGGTLPLNTWCHVAVARSGTTTKMFLNGAQTGSDYTDTNNYGTTSACRIGADDDGSPNAYLNGYISNVRVLKGTALYTSNFTPPAAPLTAITNTSLLTCQSNRFIDNSSNNFTITRNGDVSIQRFSPFSPTTEYTTTTIGGSGFFDGTTDFLTTASNTWTQLGTGNFTIEAWCYFKAYGSYAPIFDARNSSGFAPWIIGVNSSGYADFFFGTVSGNRITDNVAVGLNTWVHIAAVRNGSTITLYVNGVSKGTATYSTAVNGGSTTPSIGRLIDPIYLNGFIADARVVIGSAVYTGNFTPPTSPLTAITNTALLCNFTNSSIFDNAMMADLETVGNAQIDTAVKKFGSGSLEFDGNGDYLTLPFTPSLRFQGDFTVEFWVNPTSRVTSFPCIVSNYSTYTTNGGFAIFAGHNSANTSKYNVAFNGSFPVIQSTSNIAYGSWTHIALVRSGSTLSLYVNGVSEGTSTQTAAVAGTQNSWWIGTAGDSITTAYFNGYIDDMRITNGVARYTSNFTPPTAAFPNK